MEDIVPGYNAAKESLMAKLEEPMEMYLLTKLKLQQVLAGQPKNPSIAQELRENLLIHAREVDQQLLQDIENQ
jgi:hypothetical protein